ncbi:MAG: anti-sigma factor [Bryobacteraceae bacterium]|jgi:anti-sigma factor RsiW
MNCDDSRVYLPAYLDDELDIAENLCLQKHLADCEDCRQAQNDQLALRLALRDPGLYAHPSADFSKRIEASLRSAAKKQINSRRSTWLELFRRESLHWAPAAAVLIVAMIGTALVMNLRSSRERLIATAVLASHIRSLQANHLVDVPSSDHHTVKPWFQGKLDFSPPVPDLSGAGWILIGGRLDYVDARPVAALIYKRRMHNINVFLWPDRGSADDTIKQEEAQGYQILHWNSGETAYWVVSDLNNAELLKFARALQGR